MMTRTKTIQEIQAENEALKEKVTSLTTEQAKLQNQLVSLNLLHQFKQHGVARPYTTWYVAGGGN